MIKKNISEIVLIVISLAIIGCSGNDKFKIEKGKVGLVTQKTTIGELDNIFKNDSIVKNLSNGALGENYFQDEDAYLVFEKGGKHLLTITPKDQLDSTSTIKSIEVHDSRFKTKEGVNLLSTFSEVNINSNINKVESTFSSATIFIDDLNATIAISKEELGFKTI